MNRAMWFVWMLRTDIRGNTPIASDEGQRDFVCWWLCFGRTEYPAVWTFDPTQIEVAQAPQTPAGLPRLLAYLVRCRTDLAETFTHAGVIDVLGLLCWYRISAPAELSLAPPLPSHLAELTERPCKIPPWSAPPSPNPPWPSHITHIPHIAVELWNRTPHLQARFPANDPTARAALADWFATTGQHLLAHPTPTKSPNPARPQPPAIPHPRLRPRLRPHPLGVNLVGYPRGELGIGEDVRMLSAALDSADIPHAIVDVPFGPTARRSDDSVAGRITTRLDHPITIFCLTAFDTADLYLRHGDHFFAGAYRIGNWPWELPRFPDAWRDAYDLVDEVWAATSYTMRSYVATGLQKPLRLMPPAVAIGPVRRTPWRKTLPNPKAFTFVVPFDPYSSFRRKNPLAAVLAFRQAFPLADPSVALLLRINGDPAGRPGWPELQAAAAGDPRIRLWTQTLDRAEALGVVRDADCLVSAHRAEGFGRNIAEAKLLGTPILATGFSGNADFTTEDESIAWRPIPLAPGDYPHADGLWWAEPRIDDLARRMREIRGVPTTRKSPAVVKTASARILQQVGQAYAGRLAEIFAAMTNTKPVTNR